LKSFITQVSPDLKEKRFVLSITFSNPELLNDQATIEEENLKMRKLAISIKISSHLDEENKNSLFDEYKMKILINKLICERFFLSSLMFRDKMNNYLPIKFWSIAE
jgi:hypothetical protein